MWLHLGKEFCAHHAVARQRQKNRSTNVEGAGKDNKVIVTTDARLDERTREGDTKQHTKRGEKEHGSVALAIIPRLADLATAHGRKRKHRTIAEAVQNGKDNKARGRVAKRQPNGKDGNNGHHADENERVEAAHAVGHHARQPPTQHAHGVEHRQQRVGKRLTFALAQRVRGQKRNAINHRQLAQEIGQGKPHKPPVSKRLEVNDVFKLELEVSALKARLHEHNGQYQHKKAYEPDHTDGPGKAHRGVEGAQNKRENDTSQTAADSGSAKRRAALIIKPVANNGNHWRH